MRVNKKTDLYTTMDVVHMSGVRNEARCYTGFYDIRAEKLREASAPDRAHHTRRRCVTSRDSGVGF